MAKNIVIQDEYFKTVHMSGVTRLRTDLEGGGECYWVPEDEEMVLIGKSVSANGTYLAINDDANGYSAVTVNVANTFGEHDEGRVVSNGALVDQSSRTISANGIYDTTTNNGIIVSVPNVYTQSDEGKVVSGSTLVSQSSRTISANGTYDTTLNNSVTVETISNLSTKTITVNGTYQASTDNVDGYSDVTVSVLNTYTQSDEGKVVSNSALVSQSSRTISANGTYDTTLNDSVTVETSSNLSTKTINVNGTYQASTDNVDGYSDVTVSVPNTYAQSDEGKVVSGSALVSQSSRTISANGTYDTTTNNSVTVETSSNLSTKTITVNGTYQASTDNVDGYSDVTVSVANTYSDWQEGMVVHNQSLVPQSILSVSHNGTYDTTLYGITNVDVGDAVLITKSVTANGTYRASAYDCDGFSEVTVALSLYSTVFSNNGIYIPSSYGYGGFGEITVSVEANLGDVTFMQNGIYNASDYRHDGFSRVTVSLPLTSMSIDTNGIYRASNYGAEGFSKVEVNVEPNVANSYFSENGTYYAPDYGYDGFLEVNVDVQPYLTEWTFGEAGTYYASDYGYDGFSTVTIDVSGGGGGGISAIINRTIEEFSDSEIGTVGRYAFAGCTMLSYVTLINCSCIESGAFYDCYELATLTIPGNSVVTVYEDPFSNSNVPNIYVDANLIQDYKNHEYWGIYSSCIAEY